MSKRYAILTTRTAAASLVCWSLLLGGCLGYDATPAPVAKVSYLLDLSGGAKATVRVYDENDKVVGQATNVGGDKQTLPLTADRDYGSLRLVATAGERVLKTVGVGAPKGKTLDLGKVDAASTATAQLVQQKVAGGGGSFSSVPTSVITDLVKQVGAARKAGKITDFFALVATIAAKADTGGDVKNASFSPLSAKLSTAFVAARSKDLPTNVASDYQNKLTAGASALSINLICDAARIKVMFTVDVSGQAKDGNGTDQLVRQPTKGDKVYLAITMDDSSTVADGAGVLRTTMMPNDPNMAMVDDGTAGDEKAGDGVYTKVLVLPRGIRVKYKYANGSAGEGWTRTEEWPGNARILEVRDVLSRHTDGHPDCLVVRRDAFGDEAANKNFVNLNSKLKGAGGTLSFDKDLGGVVASKVASGRYVGGLSLGDLRSKAGLTPTGLPEALENGVCSQCPPPLTLSTDDSTAPRLVSAAFVSTREVLVKFSEALEYASASNAGNYLVVDSSARALAVSSVSASGASVTLTVAPPDFAQTYVLHVKNLKDASAAANAMARDGSTVTIGRDKTSPQLVSAAGLPLRDLNPGVSGADPTVGQVVKVTFNEELDRTTAENVANYQLTALVGDDLTVRAAYLKNRNQVWLVTEPQGKRKPYDLLVQRVRDLAGNLVKSSEPIRFYGFALYKVTFGAVPGFAFLTLDGSKRGLPTGAKLYLTGTVLSVARDLTGNPISLGGRTDLTGIPEFEMKPSSSQVFRGKPVYTLTVLAPPGTYAWKVAHGVAGEYKNPPTTLVKVHKSLATTVDGTGVNIDPATLTALPLPGADGKAISFLDYAKAALSKTGGDAPGPFVPATVGSLPAPKIMFKRENPDEVCGVVNSDKVCAPIVIGTWRDIEAWKKGGSKTDDYDDGLLDVEPLRVETDVTPPRLQQLKVRDSQSLLLTFNERLSITADKLTLTAVNAGGASLPLSVHSIGTIGKGLLPHQIMVCVGQSKSGSCDGKMENSVNYTLSYAGFADVHGNKASSSRSQTFTAPATFKPFVQEDKTAPKVIAVRPKNPTAIIVQFDEAVLASDATNSGNFSITASSGTAPKIISATVQGGGTSVLLGTGLQAQQASYTLTVSNIRDLATPPNQLKSQTISFKGFGDSQAPTVTHAEAISKNQLVVAFDEPLSATSAAVTSSYKLSAGLSVQAVAFSGSSTLKAAAFDSANTTFGDNVVVLTTNTMTAGTSYTVTPSGVTDLSGNACKTSKSFKGVAAPRKVTVIVTYTVSASATAAGKVPGKAISCGTGSEMAQNREGLFILGSTVSLDGKTKGDAKTDAVTRQLGGFPAVGQPLTGSEPQLLDDGNGNDKSAGDCVYTITIKDVPLGTSLQWKAFASYKVGKSGFADATPGPSAYQDGQEYPGNENGVRILADKNGDGVVRVNNLFGDETTYKKFTDSPAFVWVVDDNTWAP